MNEAGTIILEFGVRDGMVIKDIPNTTQSIEIAYIPDAYAVRFSPADPMPTTEILTQTYRDTGEWDEGMRIFRPCQLI